MHILYINFFRKTIPFGYFASQLLTRIFSQIKKITEELGLRRPLRLSPLALDFDDLLLLTFEVFLLSLTRLAGLFHQKTTNLIFFHK